MSKLSDYIFVSGGAKGADSIWVSTLLYYFTSPIIYVYRPEHITQLRQEHPEQYDILENQYKEVVKTLKRHILPFETYAGKLVRRDMLQVANVDSVYAIANIDSNGYIKGGTGYATTRAIHMELNVFAYDDKKMSWFKWNYEEHKFLQYDGIPLLDVKSCCVGSRNISDQGVKAIKNCVMKLKKYLDENV